MEENKGVDKIMADILGDALPQHKSKPTLQRKQRIIERLILYNNTGSIVDELDEDVLIELRASSNQDFALPF